MRLTIALLQALPPQRCEQFAEGMAVVCGSWLGMRAKTVDENLTMAFPDSTPDERRQTTRAMWRHLFLMLAEIAHAPRKIHIVNWREWIAMPQIEACLSGVMQNRPVVMLSGHYGNFELGGYTLGVFGFPSHTIARTLDNPLLDRFVNDFRGRTGQHILPKNGSGEAAQQLLEAGGILALLGDQAAGHKACWVDFFGRPASTHKAVALFSLTYDAPMMVVATRRTGGMMEYEIELVGVADPLAKEFEQGSIPLMAEWYTRQLETMIRKAPDQYWWVHNRWKGTPPNRKAKRLEQAA